MKKTQRYIRKRLKKQTDEFSDEEITSDSITNVPDELSSDSELNLSNNPENIEAVIETELVNETEFRPPHTSSPIPFDAEISEPEYSADSISISSDTDSLYTDELYRGSGIHVQDFEAEFLRIGAKHRMSDSSLRDMLGLFAEVLPPGNQCPTLHKLKKFEIEDFFTDVERKQAVNGMYYTLDVAKQIETICLRFPYIFDLPPSRTAEFGVEDVLDGVHFQNIKKPQNGVKFLYCLLSCDGVVPSHRSKGHVIWPVTLAVLNLEPRFRRKFENMILVMLFYGAKKPDFVDFMKEVVALIEATSMEFQNNVIRIRIVALVADLPAKAACLNMTQFNGYYACNFCEVKGTYLLESHKMTYPPNICKTRSVSSHSEYSRSGSNKKPSCGVKGPSPLARILAVPVAAPFDSMHLIYLGVTKTLMIYAIEKKLLNEFNASEQLCHQVTVPNEFKRRPRSLEHAPRWKANEWKLFLLYYSVPILCCNSNSKPLILLFALLSTTISILSCQSVNTAAITAATELIQAFQNQLRDNFGCNSMTFSIHALGHLPGQVRDFGPLWTHSAFAFESFYGQLTGFVTGTKCEADLIVKRFLRFHAHRSHRSTNSGNEEIRMTDRDCVTALRRHRVDFSDESKVEYSAVTVSGIVFARKRKTHTSVSQAFAIADLGEPECTFVVINQIYYFPQSGFHCLVEKYQTKSAVREVLNSADPVCNTLIRYSPLKLIYQPSTMLIKCSSLIGHFVTVGCSCSRHPCLFAVPVIRDYEHD